MLLTPYQLVCGSEAHEAFFSGLKIQSKCLNLEVI